MKTIKSATLIMTALLTFIACATKKQEEPKRTLLSKHQTIAVLKEVKEHKCLGRTSLCPDKCGHSGKVAVFEIKEYLGYKKLDRWGSDKQKQFFVQLSGFRQGSDRKPDKKTIDAINKLKVGDTVLLSWDHNRVETSSMSRGERKITKLEKKTADRKK